MDRRENLYSLWGWNPGPLLGRCLSPFPSPGSLAMTGNCSSQYPGWAPGTFRMNLKTGRSQLPSSSLPMSCLGVCIFRPTPRLILRNVEPDEARTSPWILQCEKQKQAQKGNIVERRRDSILPRASTVPHAHPPGQNQLLHGTVKQHPQHPHSYL